MTRRPTLAIVGASLAGAKAAEGARAAGYEGRVVLIGEEPHPPYERPPLSKAVLRGEADTSSTHVHPEGFYAEHAIEVVVSEVTAVDPVDRRIRLSDRSQIRYDSLVLATGAAPRRLDSPGAGLDGVHTLRTVGDALALREAMSSTSRLAVIGGGWIGCEVAASARQMGVEVVLVDRGPTPLRRVVGDQLGTMFLALHADHGVQMRMRNHVTEIRGGGRVEEVVLVDGRIEFADLVVAGIGVEPRVELAEQALGVRVDNGIVVDERLETTVPGIFAAGDVANAWNPWYRQYLRVEHWANALNQGLVAGHNAAGQRDVYERLPYFFSDQYDLGLEYVGHAAPTDALVLRGNLDERKVVAFWHQEGIVTAAMAVNVWDVVDDLKAIIESGKPVDVRRLSSPDVPLRELIVSRGRGAATPRVPATSRPLR